MEITIKEAIIQHINEFTIHHVTYMLSNGITGAIKEQDILTFGDQTLTTEEIKKKIEEWETPSDDTSSNNKPPLGVIPRDIWRWQRIKELTRALYEYSTYRLEPMLKWSKELTLLLKEEENESNER